MPLIHKYFFFALYSYFRTNKRILYFFQINKFSLFSLYANTNILFITLYKKGKVHQ